MNEKQIEALIEKWKLHIEQAKPMQEHDGDEYSGKIEAFQTCINDLQSLKQPDEGF